LVSSSFYTKIKKEKKKEKKEIHRGGDREEESENVRWCEEVWRDIYKWFKVT